MSGSAAERVRFRLWALFLLALLGGCAYSFTSGLPGHIKTVAVPLFANETSEYGIAEEVTERLVAALVRDGTLRVIPGESEATAIIEGTVRAYAEEAYTYNRQEAVEQQIIRITVGIRFYDQVREEVIWESERVFGSAVYASGAAAEDEDRTTGLAEAIQQVVDEILSGIVAGW